MTTGARTRVRTARRTACGAALLLAITALPTSTVAAAADTSHIEGQLASGATYMMDVPASWNGTVRRSPAERNAPARTCSAHRPSPLVPTACLEERTTTVNSGGSPPQRRLERKTSPQVRATSAPQAPSLPKLRARVRFSSPAP